MPVWMVIIVAIVLGCVFGWMLWLLIERVGGAPRHRAKRRERDSL